MAKKSNRIVGKVKKNVKVRTYEGLPIVDASEDAAIVITKHDTTTSRKKDPANCAAALAGRRHFKTEVRVHLTRVYVKDTKHKRWVRFITPQSITKEIISFDRGASFEPGEYSFKAPKGSERAGYVKPGKDTHGGRHSTGKHRHVTANVRMSAQDKSKR